MMLRADHDMIRPEMLPCLKIRIDLIFTAALVVYIVSERILRIVSGKERETETGPDDKTCKHSFCIRVTMDDWERAGNEYNSTSSGAGCLPARNEQRGLSGNSCQSMQRRLCLRVNKLFEKLRNVPDDPDPGKYIA